MSILPTKQKEPNPKPFRINIAATVRKGRSLLRLFMNGLEFIDENKDDIAVILGRVMEVSTNDNNTNNERENNPDELSLAESGRDKRLETDRNW